MTDLYQLPHPVTKRLVRFTDAPKVSDRMVCVGDLTDCIQRMPWTPIMSMAVLPVVGRRRFVSVGVARVWVADLEQKQHKEKARELSRFLDWVVGVVIVR